MVWIRDSTPVHFRIATTVLTVQLGDCTALPVYFLGQVAMAPVAKSTWVNGSASRLAQMTVVTTAVAVETAEVVDRFSPHCDFSGGDLTALAAAHQVAPITIQLQVRR